jgi:hypothetical protein
LSKQADITASADGRDGMNTGAAGEIVAQNARKPGVMLAGTVLIVIKPKHSTTV